MTLPAMTGSEMFFGTLVIAGFVAFIVSLAGVQAYINLKR